ncbi:GNAT family N-acetyltransferase [Streptomyces sp. NPDC101219]|uniref:GNAT family N-acetyltransferase n=1 Tax=Streptomyces sp. NPDC101219 TaxID=3366131 RepID=UPI00381DE650
MDIDIRRPNALTAAELTSWKTLQEKAYLHGSPQMANPFLSPEFTLAVGAARRGVRVAVVRDDGVHGEPVAFFPYQRGPAGVGRAVGLGLSDCQGLVHAPGFRWEARELLTACDLAIWEFDHLAQQQDSFEQSVTGTFPSPVMDVADGWDAYVARLRARSGRGTKVRLALERKMARATGEVRYVHDERDPAALRTLLAWKSAQYRRTGRSDRFAHPSNVRLAEDLFTRRTDSFAGLLSVLYVADRPVAAHFGLRSGHVLACWFPAYDPDFAKYSPGIVLHLRMARGAAEDGLSYLDLGRGQRLHKDMLKTGELSVSEGWVSRQHHPVALAHRARRAPARMLRNTVVARPELRKPADRLLKSVGRVRAHVRTS